MLSDALSFPANSDDWLPTILVGGVLSLLGFLVLPAFVVQGYLIRVLRSAARGDEEVPSFTDWSGLLVDGLKAVLVALVYGLVVVIPLGILVVILGGALGGVGGDTARVVGGLVSVVALLVAGLVGLVVSYVLPAAYANFAVEGSARAVFDLGTVLRGALTTEYAVGWLLAVVVGVVGGLVATPLTFLIVGVFLAFYVQIVTYYLFGRGFAEGLRSKGEVV